jgi:hypothetical protein
MTVLSIKFEGANFSYICLAVMAGIFFGQILTPVVYVQDNVEGASQEGYKYFFFNPVQNQYIYRAWLCFLAFLRHFCRLNFLFHHLLHYQKESALCQFGNHFARRRFWADVGVCNDRLVHLQQTSIASNQLPYCHKGKVWRIENKFRDLSIKSTSEATEQADMFLSDCLKFKFLIQFFIWTIISAGLRKSIIVLPARCVT